MKHIAPFIMRFFRFCYNNAIYAAGKHLQIDLALDIFKEMIDAEIEPDTISYACIIESAHKAGLYDTALQLFEGMRRSTATPNALILCTILEVCGKAKSLAKLEEYLSFAVKSGFGKSVRIFNVAIASFVRMKEYGKASEAFEQLKELAIPDTITYNTMIDASGRGGDWKKAVELLKEMELVGLQQDVVSFTTAIDACGKGGRLDAALEILDQMKSKGIQPNSFTFNALLDSCVRANAAEKALEVLREMEVSSVKPDTVSYSLAITACGKAGRLDDIKMLLGEMDQKGIQSNEFTFRGAILGCARPGNEMNGDQLQQQAEVWINEALQRNLTMNVHIFNAALECYGVFGAWERSLDMLETMAAVGVEPVTYSYQHVALAFVNGNQTEKLPWLMEHIVERYPAPSRKVYNSVLQHLSGRPESVLDVYFQMLAQGRDPELTTYRIVVEAYTQMGRWENVLNVLQEMEGKGFKKSDIGRQ